MTNHSALPWTHTDCLPMRMSPRESVKVPFPRFHTAGVTGSNPVLPTNDKRHFGCRFSFEYDNVVLRLSGLIEVRKKNAPTYLRSIWMFSLLPLLETANTMPNPSRITMPIIVQELPIAASKFVCHSDAIAPPTHTTNPKTYIPAHFIVLSCYAWISEAIMGTT